MKFDSFNGPHSNVNLFHKKKLGEIFIHNLGGLFISVTESSHAA